MEFSVFIDVFGWARDDYQCDIRVEICGFRKVVTSTFGVPVTMDVLIDEVCAKDYDALAVPGGFEEYGFYEEAYHEKTSAFCGICIIGNAHFGGENESCNGAMG